MLRKPQLVAEWLRVTIRADIADTIADMADTIADMADTIADLLTWTVTPGGSGGAAETAAGRRVAPRHAPIPGPREPLSLSLSLSIYLSLSLSFSLVKV